MFTNFNQPTVKWPHQQPTQTFIRKNNEVEIRDDMSLAFGEREVKN
jgi:hypothetical protein